MLLSEALWAACLFEKVLYKLIKLNLKIDLNTLGSITTYYIAIVGASAGLVVKMHAI